MKPLYADIILPLAVRGRYTYIIPDSLRESVLVGTMVSVQFGRQKITGCVASVHDLPPQSGTAKEIAGTAPGSMIMNNSQLRLWQWLADYYMCTVGEVMKAALPSEKSIEDYRPRIESCIGLYRNFTEEELSEILDKLQKRAPGQYNTLIGLLDLSGSAENGVPVRRADLLAMPGSALASINGLLKKNIIKLVLSQVTRLENKSGETEPLKQLSSAQTTAYDSVRQQFNDKSIVLLHGVTSSGKTEIYTHLIDEQLKAGRQVLYLLPEIALTTQIIHRLRKHFGDSVGVYHSRFNDMEKIEIWRKVAGDVNPPYNLILGVRSSVFLPFRNLGLVIVDEEHDSSYKQQDPAPRYQARDTAIMLAGIHGAKAILGSASPSIESYHNAVTGKYGLTELTERFGKIHLPGIVLANTREAYKRKLMVSHFTPELLYSIDNALSKGEQVILFQNRRGFSPYIECSECGWVPNCIQCAVSLTWHKGINRLVCHYCGYQSGMPHQCGNCHSTGLLSRGFGTEKIEEEIKVVFPSAKIARMDQDTTRTRNAFDRIIRRFEERQIDILIGTQMISKGLDFENLTVVGILNADNLLNFPDFRSHERGFQLLEQVSGRAGRRQKLGRVVIQTGDPSHRIIRFVTHHDYKAMYRQQSEERENFNYPPFCRIIQINLKHKSRPALSFFADFLGMELKAIFGKRVLGPEDPLVPRVQLWYIKTIILKLEKDKSSVKARQLITEAIMKTEKEKGASGLRIAVDVDPY